MQQPSRAQTPKPHEKQNRTAVPKNGNTGGSSNHNGEDEHEHEEDERSVDDGRSDGCFSSIRGGCRSESLLWLWWVLLLLLLPRPLLSLLLLLLLLLVV